MNRVLVSGLVAGTFFLLPFQLHALSLREAIETAIRTNPEVARSIENREAIEFELKQALGLYMPTLNLEASSGAQLYNSPSRRAAHIQSDPLYPSQAEVVGTYRILDGGYRKSEAARQAARVDSASFRVLERSELIGLEVARLYFEILLQQRIVDLSRRNLVFHRGTLGKVNELIDSGPLTRADRQQAVERLSAAKASLLQTQEALDTARISFGKEVGIAFSNPKFPGRVGRRLPRSLRRAIELAIQNNPRIHSAKADQDAATALVSRAKGDFAPKLSLEGRAKYGYDIGGVDRKTTDVQGRLVLSWKLFDGGIRKARLQEKIRRKGEAKYASISVAREVEEAVRTSWSRITRQNALSNQYSRQLRASNGLVASYKEQFTVNQRSLLDVLDAQNTRYNVQVLYHTSSHSARFAEYRLLAATGTLLSFLNLSAGEQSIPYARDNIKTSTVTVKQEEIKEPVNIRKPINLSTFVN